MARYVRRQRGRRTRTASGVLRESGQAAVEFALVLPLVLSLVAMGVHAVVEVRDRVLVVHAARAAARVAATTDETDRIREAGTRAVPRLDSERLVFEQAGERRPGGFVGVKARYTRKSPAILERLGIASSVIEAEVYMPAEA